MPSGAATCAYTHVSMWMGRERGVVRRGVEHRTKWLVPVSPLWFMMNWKHYMRSEVVTPVNVKLMVFRDVMWSSLGHGYWPSGGTHLWNHMASHHRNHNINQETCLWVEFWFFITRPHTVHVCGFWWLGCVYVCTWIPKSSASNRGEYFVVVYRTAVYGFMQWER
jgi:hypothetical protein